MRNLSHAHGLICLVVRWAVPVGKDIVSRRFQNVNNFFYFFQKIFLPVFGKQMFAGVGSRPGPPIARIFIYILYKATREKMIHTGPCISGKKIFCPDKTLLSGQNNLEINFQFQKTIILGKKFLLYFPIFFNYFYVYAFSVAVLLSAATNPTQLKYFLHFLSLPMQQQLLPLRR